MKSTHTYPALAVTLITLSFLTVTTSACKKNLDAGKIGSRVETAALQPKVLLFGSSTVYNWPLTDNPFIAYSARVSKMGFPGKSFASLSYLADSIYRLQPAVIVEYSGDNDVAEGHSMGRILSDWVALVQQLRKEDPDAKIKVLSIKYSGSLWRKKNIIYDTNLDMQKWIGGSPLYIKNTLTNCPGDVEFVDIATPLLQNGYPDSALYKSDFLHLNNRGYAKIDPIVEQALMH